jgi:hypothetical protein
MEWGRRWGGPRLTYERCKVTRSHAMRTLRKHIGLAGVTAALIFVAAQPVNAADAATVTRSDLSAGVFVSCALGGVGEDVLVAGTITTVLRTSTDASGGTHFVLRANYDSLSGTGLTSGTRYRAVATEGDTTHNFDPFVGPPYSFTSTRHVRFVGQGPDNDFTVIDTSHVTVNANDEVTVIHDDIRVDCG